jgi:predicted lipid-binding transport protein (Tim44 family)
MKRLGQLGGRLGRLGRLGRTRVAAAVPQVPTLGPGELDEFLRVARQSFVQLQAAWDRADLCALGNLATEPLFEELRDQLAQRGPGPNRTEVLSVDARLLAMEELGEAYVASVEFSGLIRERVGTDITPFRELWLLANLKSAGRGWQLARVQSLS